MAERVEYVVVGLGALGSAAVYELSSQGRDVVGLEQFELGHTRGASHDTSRILRHSYHTPGYVRLTYDAFHDWARLEQAGGEALVTTVGGLDLFPAGAAIPIDDYTASLSACDVEYDVLDRADIESRWPQLRLPEGTVGLFQERGSIVAAAGGTAAMRRVARDTGAILRERAPVTSITDLGGPGIEVEAGGSTYRCRRLLVCADAWTDKLLGQLGRRIPLTVTLQQVTYFAPPEPARFEPGRLPVWIWMDDPSFYGFPCYGEPTVKAAEDCGGPRVTADERSFEPDPEQLAALTEFMAGILPDSGPPVRSVTCLYTLTPDRDFVLGAVPGHESVLVGLGAAHGFKFAPTFGRLLAELAVTGTTATDLTPFRLDRPALTEPGHPASWLV